MSIQKRWSRYQKFIVDSIPNFYGVYELSDGNHNIIYIGEGKLNDRLHSHFSDGSDPIVGISFFRTELTESKSRAIQRQNKLLEEYRDTHHGRNPRFNDYDSA